MCSLKLVVAVTPELVHQQTQGPEEHIQSELHKVQTAFVRNCGLLSVVTHCGIFGFLGEGVAISFHSNVFSGRVCRSGPKGEAKASHERAATP